MSKLASDLQQLQAALSEAFTRDFDDFIIATQDRRSVVRGNLRHAALSLLFLFATSVFLFMSFDQLGKDWEFNVVTGFMLLWTVTLFVTGNAWFINTRLLAREMNMALVPIFTHLFDRMFLYTHQGDTADEVREQLNRSGLFIGTDLAVTAEDTYRVYGGEEVVFHEITASTKNIAKGSEMKDGSPVEHFRGVFMVAQLPFDHNAESYLSTETEWKGFTHQAFWEHLLARQTVTEMQTELNSPVVHIATSDSAAAEVVFAPELIEQLQHCWQEQQFNLRVSIKDEYLYVLMPGERVAIGSGTTSTKLSVIRGYAWALAQPIWRGLRLVEAVSARGV